MARDAVALKGSHSTAYLGETGLPLRCLDDAGRNLDALALTTVEWTALTATNRHVRHLRMICCVSPVVLKTSRLGTRFFAHHALGGCASGDESAEHLHLKTLAIVAARAAGWAAEAEVPGNTPDGEPWRADVLATRGRHAVAVEVQWSPQADDETRRRQARYAASGVRGLWLFRGSGFTVDADIPAVRVSGTLAAGLTILGLPAPDFLAAVFDRRLRFGLPVGTTAALTVWGAVETCWGTDCRAQTRGVTGIEIALGGSRCVAELAGLGAHVEVMAALDGLLPADPLRGGIRVRRADKTAVAECFCCDRPLTRFAPRSRYTVVRAPLKITPAWLAMIAVQPSYMPVWSVAPVAPNPAIP